MEELCKRWRAAADRRRGRAKILMEELDPKNWRVIIQQGVASGLDCAASELQDRFSSETLTTVVIPSYVLQGRELDWEGDLLDVIRHHIGCNHDVDMDLVYSDWDHTGHYYVCLVERR